MISGDVVLARIPLGSVVDAKPRPALVVAALRSLTPTVLLCGISSRVDASIEGWDVVVDASHPDFAASGLHVPSAIRPSWLVTFPDNDLRKLGRVGDDTLRTVRSRLISALQEPTQRPT